MTAATAARDAVFIDVLPSMKGFGSAVTSGSVGASAGAGKASGMAFGKAMLLGVAVVVGGAALAGKALYDIGKTFDDMTDTIRVGTGATGDALDALVDSAKSVGTQVPADFADVGTAIADVNTRLGLTGKPLEDLTAQFLEMSRITGTDVATNIADVTRVFGDWGIETEAQASTMDHLFKVSQSTGIGVDTLSTKVVQFGAPLRQLGFSFEESTALLGKFEQEGVNSDKVMSGMVQSLGRMAKAGEDPVETFQRVTEEIKNAGTAGEANGIALELFGTRAGPDMAAAIREGRFEIDDLMTSLDASSETIMTAGADTMDFSEQWRMFKNKAMVGLAPIAEKVFGALTTGMEWINTTGIPIIERFAEWLGPKLQGPMRWIKDVGAAVFNEITGGVKAFAAAWKANNGDITSSGFPGFLERMAFVARTVFDEIKGGIKAFAFAWKANDGDITSSGFPGVMERIGYWARQAFDYIRDTALPAIQGFIAEFRNGEGAGGKLRDILTGVWNAAKTAFGWIRDEGLPALMALGRFIMERLWPDIKAAFVDRIIPAVMEMGRVIQNFWVNFAQPALSKLWVFIRDVLAPFLVDFYENGVKPTFDLIGKVISKTFAWVRDTGWPWMRDALAWIGEKASWLWTEHVKPAFDNIKSKANTVFTWVKDTGWPWMRDALQKVGDKATWLYDEHIKPAFNSIKSIISGAWDSARDSFDSLKRGVTGVQESFGRAVQGIGDAWDKVKQIVATPIVAVINFINDGIIGGINKVLDWAGVSGIPKIPVPGSLVQASYGGGARSRTMLGAGGRNSGRGAGGGYADGGVLPGYSPGRDDMHFAGPAGRLSLSGGEAIMVPEWTRAIGKAGVDAMNRLARSGGAQAVREHLGFSSGGVLPGGRAAFGLGGVVSSALSAGSGVVNFFRDPIGFLKDLLGKGLSAITSNPLYGVARGAVGKIASGAKDKLLEMLGFGEVGPKGGRSLGGKGMSSAQIKAFVAGLDPSARMTSGYRPGAVTASGVPSYHGLDRAGDFVSNNMSGLARKLAATGAQWAELYYTPWGFMRRGRMVPSSQVAAVTKANHYSHVHAAMAKGGLVPKVYDSGGILPPGGAGINLSSKPELVLTQGQLARMGGATTVYVENPWTGEYHEARMRDVADDSVTAASRRRTNFATAGAR